MYSHKKDSYSESMKYIVWSTLFLAASYIIFSVGRMIVESFPEVSLGQIFLILVISVIFTICFLGIKDMDKEMQPTQYNPSLDQPIDILFESEENEKGLETYEWTKTKKGIYFEKIQSDIRRRGFIKKLFKKTKGETLKN